MAEGTMIDMGDGFGGMSLLSGGAGFVGGLVLGSLWNGNGSRLSSLRHSSSSAAVRSCRKLNRRGALTGNYSVRFRLRQSSPRLRIQRLRTRRLWRRSIFMRRI